jgi:TrmH family RNA methyltransferase
VTGPGQAEGLQITSTRNPKVKALRSLRLRKVRTREGRYLIEGIRIVEEALGAGAPVETLAYAPDLLVSERARGLVHRVEPGRRLALSGDVFRSLSSRDEPQGIAAAVRIEERSLADLPASPDLLVLVACQLADPGNLGTLIRTADSAGATGVVVVGPSVDLYDPQTVRATMGSLYALPVVRLDDEAALVPWYRELRAAGLPLLVAGSSAHGQRDHFEVDTCARWCCCWAASARACHPKHARGPTFWCGCRWPAGPRRSTSPPPRLRWSTRWSASVRRLPLPAPDRHCSSPKAIYRPLNVLWLLTSGLPRTSLSGSFRGAAQSLRATSTRLP